MSKLSDAIELWSQSSDGNGVFGYSDFDDEFDTEWKNGSLEIQLSLGEQYPAFVRDCRKAVSSIGFTSGDKHNIASLFAIPIQGFETDILEVVETGLPAIEEACLKSGLALPGSKVVMVPGFISNEQMLPLTPSFIRSLLTNALRYDIGGLDVRGLLGKMLPASAMPPKKRARNNAFTSGMLVGVRLKTLTTKDWFDGFDAADLAGNRDELASFLQSLKPQLPERAGLPPKPIELSDFTLLADGLNRGLDLPIDIDNAIAQAFSTLICFMVCVVTLDCRDKILDNLYLHTRDNTLFIAMTHGGKWIKPQTLDLANVGYNIDMAMEIVARFAKTIEVCDRSRFAQVCQNRGA